MNFQNIRPISRVDDYLDAAFSKAKKKASQMKGKFKRTDISKQKRIEYSRLDTIKDVLEERLVRVLKDFPSIDSLNEFYQELIKATVDYVALKKSLGAVNTAIKLVKDLHRDYLMKIKRTEQLKRIDQLRREFYGRISSVPKRITKELEYLEQVRQVMRTYPDVKDMPTVAIAGFPNVGKTTLLSKLSKSKPEIAEYAFTTRKLNLGYMEVGSKKIQLVDTPGTLDRLEKMNDIEKQAYLAIKHLANLVVYVFDLTEPFPLDKQEKLLKAIKQSKKKVLVYLSKGDLLAEEKVKDFLKRYKGTTDAEEIKEKIGKSL